MKQLVSFLKESMNRTTDPFKSDYTSIDIADLSSDYDDMEKYDVAVQQITDPWNKALKNVGLPDGIYNGEPDSDDIADSGIFYMAPESQPYYVGKYELIEYNGVQISVLPALQLDKDGNITPYVIYVDDDEAEEMQFIVKVSSPDEYARKLKKVLTTVYKGSGEDVQELIRTAFTVTDTEEM